jgi:hypothetical protein
MSHLHTNRTRFIVLACALLAVAASLVIVISRVSAEGLNSSVCNALRQGEVRLADVRPQAAEPDLWPAGYRLP